MKMENSYGKLRKTDFPKKQLQYIHNVKRCEYEKELIANEGDGSTSIRKYLVKYFNFMEGVL